MMNEMTEQGHKVSFKPSPISTKFDCKKDTSGEMMDSNEQDFDIIFPVFKLKN